MAAPVNNIAATFSAIKTTNASTTAPSLSSSSFTPPTSLSLSSSPAAAASWNPHSSLSWTLKSSLLDLYGPPGPSLPLRPFSTVEHSHQCNRPKGPGTLQLRDRIAISASAKLPSVYLSYLDRNDAVRNVTLGGLCKGKRRVVVVGVSAAFSPDCTRFLRRVLSAETSRSADVIACVAKNDVFVMSAWGRSLAAVDDGRGDSGKLMMLSGGGSELFGALGVSRDLSPSCSGFGGGRGRGGGTTARRFCLSVSHGIVTHVTFDDVGGEDYENLAHTGINGRGCRCVGMN